MSDKEIMWVRCNWFDEEIEDVDYEEYSDDYDKPQGMKPMKVHSLIQTPFGLAKYSDKMTPIHDTVFYIGHLNFNLSHKVIDIIKRVPGVEYMKPMGRYRFIVGAGLMFDIKTVCMEIEVALGITSDDDVLSEDDLSESVKDVITEIKQLSSNNKHWAAYVFPNGRIMFKGYDNDDEVELAKKELLKLKEFSNGMVITSIK